MAYSLKFISRLKLKTAWNIDLRKLLLGLTRLCFASFGLRSNLFQSCFFLFFALPLMHVVISAFYYENGCDRFKSIFISVCVFFKWFNANMCFSLSVYFAHNIYNTYRHLQLQCKLRPNVPGCTVYEMMDAQRKLKWKPKTIRSFIFDKFFFSRRFHLCFNSIQNNYYVFDAISIILYSSFNRLFRV